MSKVRPPDKKTIIKKFDGDNVPEEFTFPSIGIENIDRALFNLFDKKSMNKGGVLLINAFVAFFMYYLYRIAYSICIKTL